MASFTLLYSCLTCAVCVCLAAADTGRRPHWRAAKSYFRLLMHWHLTSATRRDYSICLLFIPVLLNCYRTTSLCNATETPLVVTCVIFRPWCLLSHNHAVYKLVWSNPTRNVSAFCFCDFLEAYTRYIDEVNSQFLFFRTMIWLQKIPKVFYRWHNWSSVCVSCAFVPRRQPHCRSGLATLPSLGAIT